MRSMLVWSKILLAISTYWVLVVSQARGKTQSEPDAPWSRVEKRADLTNHTRLFEGMRFSDGPSVTRACLTCHPEAATQVMKTSHWNWLGEPQTLPGRSEPVRIGKRNLMNNFCISIESNWPKCTVCHAGYGWQDERFDFANQELVDCLVCHDRSGTYAKTLAGIPEKDIDLMLVAKSVGPPTRDNCGWCHFNGGGGDAVKHGDLDGSLAKPVERIDIHMGRLDFQCTQCHRTREHRISGKMISVNTSDSNQIGCTDCHSRSPHRIERINRHAGALACQSCHVPEVAKFQATKVAWDWSTAGRDTQQNDPHRYLKAKGSFLYVKKLIPKYMWFNGRVDRYLKGDRINPDEVVHINLPMGRIEEPDAKIWPFKVHRAKQPYDVENAYLLVPKTWGAGGYWTDFDWNQAAELGSEASGLPFSGKMGFVETDMVWKLTHMVAPARDALRCVDCHAGSGRMDWLSLGYDGDPALVGGRKHRRQLLRNQ